ncbi:hypothetical protein [Sulfolobus sp. E11-6]|nr:hypothetical protein [Sulfolobus sp. E11-6]QGA69045.1 hypothetical protein GFS33_10305 [Sulfolobus sp. E11-6]
MKALAELVILKGQLESFTAKSTVFDEILRLIGVKGLWIIAYYCRK